MEYRDVHDTKEQLIYFLNEIDKSKMSSKQKKNIHKFVEELRLGKAGQVKVKDRRIKNYLMFLLKLHKYFKKDLDTVTEKDATKFYKDLLDDKIKKDNGMPFAPATKDEYTKTLKRYLSWKWGSESNKYKKNVQWMKKDYKKSNRRAIPLQQADEIIKKAINSRVYKKIW